MATKGDPQPRNPFGWHVRSLRYARGLARELSTLLERFEQFGEGRSAAREVFDLLSTRPDEEVDAAADVLRSHIQAVDRVHEIARRKLQAARDEIMRLRPHVRVGKDDVERAGVTPTQLDAWLEASSWARYRDKPGPLGQAWVREGQIIAARTDSFGIALVINDIAFHEKRSAWDVLDEMSTVAPAWA